MGDVTEVAIWLLMFSHLTGMGSLSVLSPYPNMANHQASDAFGGIRCRHQHFSIAQAFISGIAGEGFGLRVANLDHHCNSYLILVKEDPSFSLSWSRPLSDSVSATFLGHRRYSQIHVANYTLRAKENGLYRGQIAAMKSTSLLCSLLFPHAIAFPWLRPDAEPNDLRRGLQAIRRDPETAELIRDLYQQQKKEKRDFFENRQIDEPQEAEFAGEKRATANCMAHPLPDFYPTNITGLKKFPEAAYPYQDPVASNQRGPCPGLNTLANHGYINRNGITTVAQSVAAAAYVFNMGADLAAFLAGGSVLFAGDLPSMTYSIGGADARTNSLGIVGGSLGTETGLSGHLRFKEGDASGTRCDFYLCNGDNHNLNPSVFSDFQNAAKTYGGGQYNVPAITHHLATHYTNSRNTNPYFYFFPPQAALTVGAEYFHAGFFSNGTIGFGGVANEASIASFNGAHFSSNGTISYMPEQIPSQGWYRRGFPMTLGEGIDGILTLYTGAAAILGDPLLFGANTGQAGHFTGAFSLDQFGGPGSDDGTTINGVACAIEESIYGNFVSEFSGILNVGTATINEFAAPFAQFGCPVPTGAPAVEADAPTYPGYPKPQPCKLNKMQNGLDQCAPDTNTYAEFNTAKVPFCLNNPTVAAPASNPFPVV